MFKILPQLSKFKAEKSRKICINVLQRLYSWDFIKRFKCMLAYYLYVFVLLVTVLSTFGTDEPQLNFSPNGSWATSNDTNDEMFERLDSIKIIW